MSRIFVSHAVADKKLATAFLKFLKEAIGVPAADIFCSSVDGHGIPTGENFSEYMKKQIDQPDLVIMLITETYMEREFCLMELGATWAKSLNPFPIIVPPVDYDAVTRTLGLVQGQKIDDHKKLNFLRSALGKVCKLEPRTDEDWDEKREEWKLTLDRVLPNLPKATKVSREVYDQLLKSVEHLNERLSQAEDAIEEKDEVIAALKELKDAEGVAELEASYADSSLEEEFKKLIADVREANPSGVCKAVFKHLIMDHYGKAQPIDWFGGDADEYRDAISRNLLDAENFDVKWAAPKLKRLRKALEALDGFMMSSSTAPLVQRFENKGISADTDDLDFWDQNL